MAEIKHGTVTVILSDHVKPPERAGRMDQNEMNALAKARRGVGLVCEDAADSITKVGSKLTLPPDVTAAALQAAGRRAEDVDQVIVDLELVLNTVKQANLVFDSEAHLLLGRVNDAVKAQSKQNPELQIAFQSVQSYFANKRTPKKEG